MKHITIGFTAIIAILAMSFTLASKSGKIAKADLIDGCYITVSVRLSRPSGIITITLLASGAVYNGVATITTNATNFPPAFKAATVLDKSIGIFVEDHSSECPLTIYPDVCCYYIVNNKIVRIRFGKYTPTNE